jgi:hypothetical protein
MPQCCCAVFLLCMHTSTQHQGVHLEVASARPACTCSVVLMHAAALSRLLRCLKFVG